MSSGLQPGDRAGKARLRAAALCVLLACTPAAAVAEDATDVDPWEDVNRAVFSFNQFFDDHFFSPIAEAYVEIFPTFFRVGLSNVIKNAKTPVILANDLLQGEFTRATATVVRFGMNTVLGAGGIIDVAGELGTPYHSEDFGQTLAVYGVGSGPYLMLPFIGPSTARDAVGLVADGFIDPIGYGLETEGTIARAGVEGLDRRATFLDESRALESTSLDYYASIRSVYLQNREYEIRNGGPAPIQDIYSGALFHGAVSLRQ